jgi:hypothetical protein
VRVWHLLGLVGLLVALLGIRSEAGGLLMGLLVAAALVAYVALWVHEFHFLMSLTDQDFPGRYDKPIWAAALVLLGPLGLWAFHRYRVATWAEPADAPAAKPAMFHDLFHDVF